MSKWDACFQILVETEVSCAGQALGIILAETREAALAGAKKVKVEYAAIEKPVIGIEDALQLAEKEGLLDKMFIGSFPSIPLEGDEETPCVHSIEGQFKIGGQAHFHMEMQGCICVPMEDGMDIFCGTQWVDQTVAGALGVPNNS